MIALVDYGAGNLTSVVKAIVAVGAEVDVINDAFALAGVLLAALVPALRADALANSVCCCFKAVISI